MPSCFDIEVALSTVYPLIWRRFLLKATDTTFADLHRAIQDACGWSDYHLYRFDDVPRRKVGIAQSPVGIEEYFDGTPPADDVPLAAWVGRDTPRACAYEYDFGDSWRHDVIVRGIVDTPDRFFRRLRGGERAFPPEDCGGPYGFAEVLAFVETGAQPDPDVDLGEWLGDWRPTVDIDRVRASFDTTRKPRARG